MKMKKRFFYSLTVAATMLSLSSTVFVAPTNILAASHANTLEKHQEKLPLGTPELEEMRSVQQIAPGVIYTSIKRGFQSSEDYHTIDAGFFTAEDEAEKLKQKLKDQGFDSFIIQVNNNSYNDLNKDQLGFIVRTGKFATQEEATAYKNQLTKLGFSNLRVTYSGYDGTHTTGPWSIHVLEIDRRLTSNMTTTLAMDQVEGKETITSIAKRTNVLASINGGYFVMTNKDGTPGDLAGISVLNGELVSEAIRNRSGFILSEKKASISNVSTSLTVQSSDGSVRELDGLNRTIGLIRNCGEFELDSQNGNPMHDVTCSDDSELIQYNPIYGKDTPKGNGVEVVLDQNGRVTELIHSRGQEIPETGSIIAGTGEAADWLKEHAKIGMPLTIDKNVLSNGKPLSLNSQTHIVNGGPLLLKNNRYDIQAAHEGFVYNNEFFYRFGINRNPRTLIGIKPNGNLLLVAADGRSPQAGIGLSFEESAKLMKALGAKDAMNLDGGGSTTMVINGQMVTHPSDAAGERPVADAISLLR